MQYDIFGISVCNYSSFEGNENKVGGFHSDVIFSLVSCVHDDDKTCLLGTHIGHFCQRELLRFAFWFGSINVLGIEEWGMGNYHNLNLGESVKHTIILQSLNLDLADFYFYFLFKLSFYISEIGAGIPST